MRLGHRRLRGLLVSSILIITFFRFFASGDFGLASLDASDGVAGVLHTNAAPHAAVLTHASTGESRLFVPVTCHVCNVLEFLQRVMDGVRAGLSWAYRSTRNATTAFYREPAAPSVAFEALPVTSAIIDEGSVRALVVATYPHTPGLVFRASILYAVFRVSLYLQIRWSAQARPFAIISPLSSDQCPRRLRVGSSRWVSSRSSSGSKRGHKERGISAFIGSHTREADSVWYDMCLVSDGNFSEHIPVLPSAMDTPADELSVNPWPLSRFRASVVNSRMLRGSAKAAVVANEVKDGRDGFKSMPLAHSYSLTTPTAQHVSEMAYNTSSLVLSHAYTDADDASGGLCPALPRASGRQQQDDAGASDVVSSVGRGEMARGRLSWSATKDGFLECPSPLPTPAGASAGTCMVEMLDGSSHTTVADVFAAKCDDSMPKAGTAAEADVLKKRYLASTSAFAVAATADRSEPTPRHATDAAGDLPEAPRRMSTSAHAALMHVDMDAATESVCPAAHVMWSGGHRRGRALRSCVIHNSLVTFFVRTDGLSMFVLDDEVVESSPERMTAAATTHVLVGEDYHMTGLPQPAGGLFIDGLAPGNDRSSADSHCGAETVEPSGGIAELGPNLGAVIGLSSVADPTVGNAGRTDIEGASAADGKTEVVGPTAVVMRAPSPLTTGVEEPTALPSQRRALRLSFAIEASDGHLVVQIYLPSLSRPTVTPQPGQVGALSAEAPLAPETSSELEEPAESGTEPRESVVAAGARVHGYNVLASVTGAPHRGEAEGSGSCAQAADLTLELAVLPEVTRVPAGGFAHSVPGRGTLPAADLKDTRAVEAEELNHDGRAQGGVPVAVDERHSVAYEDPQIDEVQVHLFDSSSAEERTSRVSRSGGELLGCGSGLNEQGPSEHMPLPEPILECLSLVEEGDPHPLVEVELASPLKPTATPELDQLDRPSAQTASLAVVDDVAFLPTSTLSAREEPTQSDGAPGESVAATGAFSDAHNALMSVNGATDNGGRGSADGDAAGGDVGEELVALLSATRVPAGVLADSRQGGESGRGTQSDDVYSEEAEQLVLDERVDGGVPVTESERELGLVHGRDSAGESGAYERGGVAFITVATDATVIVKNVEGHPAQTCQQEYVPCAGMENLYQVQEPVKESVDALANDLVEEDSVQGVLEDSFAGSQSETRQVASADDMEAPPGVVSASSSRLTLTAVADTGVRKRAMRTHDLPQGNTGVAIRPDTPESTLSERLSTASASRPAGRVFPSPAEGEAVTSQARTDAADFLPPFEAVSFTYTLWLQPTWLLGDGRGSAWQLGAFLVACAMVAFCVAVAVVYVALLLLRATYCKEPQRCCRCHDLEAATTDYTLPDAFINAMITHTHFPQGLELLECVATHSRTGAIAYTQIIAACINSTDEVLKGLGQSHVRVAEKLVRSHTTPTNRARNARKAAPASLDPASDAASDGSEVSNTSSLPRLPEPLAKDLCEFVRDSNVRAMLFGMAMECVEGAHLFLDLLYLHVHLLLSPGLKNYRDVANQRSKGMSVEQRQRIEQEVGEEAATGLSAALTLVSSEVHKFTLVSRGEALHPAVRMRLDSFEALLSKGQNAVAASEVGITRMLQETKAKNAKAAQKARQREAAKDGGHNQKKKHEEEQPTAMPVLSSEDDDTAAAGGGGGLGASDGRA